MKSPLVLGMTIVISLPTAALSQLPVVRSSSQSLTAPTPDRSRKASETGLKTEIETSDVDSTTAMVASKSEDLYPLRAILRQANASLEFCRGEIRDYTCTLIAQERINGQLGHPKSCQAKVRHECGPEPSSVTSVSIYLKFQEPASMKGREVLLVSGKNDGKMLVRKGGMHLAHLTALVEPTGTLAMHGSRYSIHEFGIQRLIERMIEFGNNELAQGNSRVNVCEGVEMGERRCTSFELIHPVRQQNE